MQARELWRQEEEGKERWREWQVRVWRPRMAATVRPRVLTSEEWAFLAEHFAGANDPTAQSIHAKALLNLSASSERPSAPPSPA